MALDHAHRRPCSARETGTRVHHPRSPLSWDHYREILMRKPLAVIGATLLTIAASVLAAVSPASAATAATGLHISGHNIVEANGQNFIMRGISHAHVWFPSQTSSFANIKAKGANTVRVVLGSGKRWG